MTKTKVADTLAGFHLRNPDTASYALIAHLISILDKKDFTNHKIILRNVTSILQDAEATHILHLMCQKMHVDYLSLLETCQQIAQRHITPRLLLHILLLPPSYISQQLEVDPIIALELLNELYRSFNIDDPIEWLKGLLNSTQKARLHEQHAKEDLLHGLAVVDQPIDTAEERKLRDRRLKPVLRPHPMDS
jgi:hypothetical protein